MSIETTAYLIFGAPYSVWKEHMDYDTLNALIYEGKLDHASPWYDSDRKHWFVGKIVVTRGQKFEESSNQTRKIHSFIQKICPEILQHCYLTVYPNVM